MDIKKELLYKPNQTIMITNKDITVTQRKAYNVILFKAWNDLKKNPKLTEFNFLISDLKDKAGLLATDNVKLKKGLQQLTTVAVEIVKDNGDWEVFSLLSYAKKEQNFLVVELPKPIRQALIDNTYYTKFDLLTLRSLQGKYAIILYEMAVRYQKWQIPEMTIEELKLLTGTGENKGYSNFKNFNDKVLSPAVYEINEKTDIILSFEQIKVGRKVASVKFIIDSKNQTDIINQKLLSLEKSISTSEFKVSSIVNEFKTIFKNKYKATLNSKLTQKMIDKKGIEHVLSCLDKYATYTKDRCIKNIAGDFYTFVMDGYEKPVGQSQFQNFEQREYTEDEFDKYIVNGK